LFIRFNRNSGHLTGQEERKHLPKIGQSALACSGRRTPQRSEYAATHHQVIRGRIPEIGLDDGCLLMASLKAEATACALDTVLDAQGELM
jgi:hypothetical protein